MGSLATGSRDNTLDTKNPEAPGSKASSTRRSRREPDLGNMEKSRPLASSRGWTIISASGSRVGTPTREGWGELECG